MGRVSEISYDRFPAQSRWVGKRVVVCYHFNASRTHEGEIVRDDTEAPYQLIIRLDCGRYVRSAECQYSFAALDEAT